MQMKEMDCGRERSISTNTEKKIGTRKEVKEREKKYEKQECTQRRFINFEVLLESNTTGNQQRVHTLNVQAQAGNCVVFEALQYWIDSKKDGDAMLSNARERVPTLRTASGTVMQTTNKKDQREKRKTEEVYRHRR